MIDRIEIKLRGADGLLPVYFDVYDNSLSVKWLSEFNKLAENTKERFPNKLFLYIDTEGHQKNLELIGNELDLSIATLPWYLSKGYVKGLGHLILEDELPAIAIVHSTNNIKSIHSGYESVINYLSLDKY